VDHSHPDVPDGGDSKAQQGNTAVPKANVPVDAGRADLPVPPGGDSTTVPKSTVPVVTGRVEPTVVPGGGDILGPVHIDSLRKEVQQHAEKLRNAQPVGAMPARTSPQASPQAESR
jgi:hypothetical protein